MLPKSGTKIIKSASPVLNRGGTYVKLISLICILLASCMPAIFPCASAAQELDYPLPLKPDNDMTGVKVNITAFSWKPFFSGTEKYRLEISKNPDMSNPIFSKEVSGTSYSYNEGQFEYDTSYFWRVTATQPMGGNPSPIFKFTTEKATGTQPPSQTSQSSDSFIDYMINNPLFAVTLVGGIIITALAIFMASKPKKRSLANPPPQQASTGATVPPPPISPSSFAGTQAQVAPSQLSSSAAQGTTPQFSRVTPQPPGSICSRCNTPNAPGRKFCNSCGANLVPVPPPPPPQNQGWGSPQVNTCPSCGTVNTPGRKFCSNCGSGMASAAPSPPPPQQASEQPQGLVCQSCGTANTPNRKFCSNCGTALASEAQQGLQQHQQELPPQGTPSQDFQPQSINVIQEFTCPICGTTITKGNNPCPKCGTELDWGT